MQCSSAMTFWPCIMWGSGCPSSLSSLLRSAAMPSATQSGWARSRVGWFDIGSIRQTGLSPAQIARVVGFISFAFGVGAFSVTSLCIELRAQEMGYLLGASPGILQMIAGGCLALVFAFLAVWLIHSRPIRLGALEIAAPSANLVFALLALGTADILAASAVLWVLVPASPFDFLTFTALYASALILGMLTHIPGGLGVFEVVIFFALGRSTPVSTLAAALLAYRAIYFLLPLLLSALLLVGFEVGRSLTVLRPHQQGVSH